MIFGPWLAASDIRKGGRAGFISLSFSLSSESRSDVKQVLLSEL